MAGRHHRRLCYRLSHQFGDRRTAVRRGIVSALSQDVLLDSLGKALGFHWPNFAAIFEKMRESEVDFCQFCGEDLQKCMLCPFNSYNN